MGVELPIICSHPALHTTVRLDTTHSICRAQFNPVSPLSTPITDVVRRRSVLQQASEDPPGTRNTLVELHVPEKITNDALKTSNL